MQASGSSKLLQTNASETNLQGDLARSTGHSLLIGSTLGMTYTTLEEYINEKDLS